MKWTRIAVLGKYKRFKKKKIKDLNIKYKIQ